MHTDNKTSNNSTTKVAGSRPKGRGNVQCLKGGVFTPKNTKIPPKSRAFVLGCKIATYTF